MRPKTSTIELTFVCDGTVNDAPCGRYIYLKYEGHTPVEVQCPQCEAWHQWNLVRQATRTTV